MLLEFDPAAVPAAQLECSTQLLLLCLTKLLFNPAASPLSSLPLPSSMAAFFFSLSFPLPLQQLPFQLQLLFFLYFIILFFSPFCFGLGCLVPSFFCWPFLPFFCWPAGLGYLCSPFFSLLLARLLPFFFLLLRVFYSTAVSFAFLLFSFLHTYTITYAMLHLSGIDVEFVW